MGGGAKASSVAARSSLGPSPEGSTAAVGSRAEGTGGEREGGEENRQLSEETKKTKPEETRGLYLVVIIGSNVSLLPSGMLKEPYITYKRAP